MDRFHPSKKREQGMPDARRTRSLVREERKRTSSHHRFAETFRHSLRDGFTVSFVLAPETGLVVSVAGANAQDIHAGLISASGYQAHTTSPSASLALVLRKRKASTASRVQRS
jgi:hypothetical protein